MTIKTIEGISAPVAFSSIVQHFHLGQPATIDMFLVSGGFMCGYFGQEGIDHALNNPVLPDSEKEVFRTMRPGPMIHVLSDIADTLTEAEVKAMLLHEECHIKHEDYSHTASMTMSVNNVPLIDNLDFEIRADAYAAKQVGVDNIRNALLKCVAKTRDIIESFTNKERADQYMQAVQDSESYQKRLAALQSV